MSHARAALVSSFVTAGVIGALLFLFPRRAGEPPRTLAQPSHLSPQTRDDIHRHMSHHGSDMIELAWDVALLDDDATAATAERISRSPALPTGNELPQRLYQLEDEMLAAAVRLGQAARAHDADEVASVYGRLATSCVACHRVYLRR